MSPPSAIRRSPVDRSVVAAMRNASPARTAAGSLRISDLSLLPRWGLKGREVFSFLAGAGVTLPAADNIAERHGDGTLIARLSPGEALILAPPPNGRSIVAPSIEQVPVSGQGACYPVPRRDSHCWIAVTGSAATEMFAKLCAVDLSPDRFADGAIAQTSVARLSAIVIRHDVPGAPGFFLLAESVSAEYLWDCLTDAMEEFGGMVSRIDAIWPAPDYPGGST